MKKNLTLEEKWKMDDDGLMVKLDLPCCIFDENEPKHFQHFFEMINAFDQTYYFPYSMLEKKTIPCINT